MNATLHRFRRWPDEDAGTWARGLLAGISGDGQEDACVLGRLDGADGALLVLWRTPADAAAVRVPDPGFLVGSGSYELLERVAGSAAGSAPEFAQVLWFPGGNAARTDAHVRAGRERIDPAMRTVSGVVVTYVLRGADDALVVVTLVTGLPVLEDMRRAVFATDLLPWEDPALLTDPERVDVDRVLHARLATGVRS
ncbi:hypothetical protein JKP75_11690 [Blastococcus sp. TML/M2B]|uniref:hypothetical protein n=1 Tax=Blastococcus sp. TML/M2B TaxID=2798727 RepID=UPI00190B9929|nr:hypothetical protein [Blastococcus sp. TML/M2B]MBN1093157.1 hypothetical protein [Blastococcus sp. TML/M2B]